MSELRYRGLLYRALNPIVVGEPFSGRGMTLYAGGEDRLSVIDDEKRLLR